MNNRTINVKVNFHLIKEDTQYEYFIPIYPFCSCKFNELEQKCLDLKQCLPEDIVDVYVPSVEEVKDLPEEIRDCYDWWWTSSPNGRTDAYYVETYGDISSYASFGSSYGFRPIIVRRK